MKQVLSMDQVNKNLSENANLKCYKVDYNRFNDQPYYHFKLNDKALIVAFGKKVFYHELNGENNHCKMPVTIEDREYVPLADKKDAEKLLIACGLIQSKKILAVKPEQRLKEICGQSIANIYKMMVDLNDIEGNLVTKYTKDYWGNIDENSAYLALEIKHSRGSFSIPIENIAEWQYDNDEAQNIFFNALNLPVTSKLKTA